MQQGTAPAQTAERHAAIARPELTAQIGTNLREARQRRGLALSEVAADAGISVATLSRIENGKQGLDASLLIVVANIIDVAPAVLMGSTAAAAKSEAVIAALAAMPAAERRRVVQAAMQQRVGSGSDKDLLEEAAADLAAAAEKLLRVKQSVAKSPRSKT